MYAYRSYNPDAPENPEPRFPAPVAVDSSKGTFSWSSLLTGRKDDKRNAPQSPLKSPLKGLAGFLAGRKPSNAPDKLEEILARLDMLQSLVEDGADGKSRGTPSMSRRFRKPRRGDEDDGDDESEGSDTGRRTRPSLRWQNKSPQSSRYSRQDSLGTVADDAFRAAAMAWHSKSDDGKSSIKSRLKSSLKAGAKEAGKSSLRQVKHSLTGRSPVTTSLASNEADGTVSPNSITAHLSDFASLGMGGLVAMMKGKKKEEAKHADKDDRHERFRKEYLDLPDDSSDIDEDLFDDLLPPVQGDNSTPLESLSSKNRKGREQLGAKKPGKSSDSLSRPLHFDPSLPSVQSFAWPDAEEIAEHAREDKEGDKGASRSKSSRDRASSSVAGPSRSKEGKLDMDELMKQMMPSGSGAKDFLPGASSKSVKSGPSKGKATDMNALMKQVMGSNLPRTSKDQGESAKIVELPDSDEDEPDMEELLRTMRSTGASNNRGVSDRAELDLGKASGFALDDGEPDMDEMMREMMRSAGASRNSDVHKEDTWRSKPSGRVPSPLDTSPRNLRMSPADHLGQGASYHDRGMGDSDFGIAWPSTPTHEPGYDSLPEYVSPATEAFNRDQERSRRGAFSESRAISIDELPAAPISTHDQVLFRRVVATMNSCLGKAKALAQKQHQYQGGRLSTSGESMVLRVIGSWLMKQIPPLERANELFSHAESECMFEFLEELVRMDGMLSHPGLNRERWEADVYEHLQAETESVQRCFLGVATTAVVGYLRQKSSRLTEDMPRVLYTCEGMLKERPKDPAQVLLVLPKIRAQLRDARNDDDSGSSGQIDEAEGLLDILYELTVELGAGFPSDPPSEPQERGEPSQSEPPSFRSDMPSNSSEPRRLTRLSGEAHPRGLVDTERSEPRPSSTRGPPGVELTSPKPENLLQPPLHLPGMEEAASQRGFAADFFDAPTPGPSGFSTAALEDLERKQGAASGSNPRVASAGPSVMNRTPGLDLSKESSSIYKPVPATPQPGESLLMAERPRPAPPAPVDPETEISDQEGKGSSSSSDEGGYASGMDALSILPILLRKKLEGKRKTLVKPPLLSKLGLVSGPREQPRTMPSAREVQEDAPPTEVVSRDSPAGSMTKSRSPGSFFPPSESLAVIPKPQEEPREALRMRPGPVTNKPSVYTPTTASPLRASTSLMSPEELTAGAGLIEQQRPSVPSPAVAQANTFTPAAVDTIPSVTSPTGMIFSDPFATDATAIPSTAAESEDGRFYTPMASPTTEDMEIDAAAEAIIEETEATGSDSESVQSNEVLTSEDIKAGQMDAPSDEDETEEAVQALTEAEKDLVALEPEALIPGPREIITAPHVRDPTQYDDFPATYRGAVPRIEVTPGAIQNTKGEVIPIDDEDIHLAAGETLIDGTGRVWNAKGMIEPGRDEQGLPILYEVDIAQIRRFNNGEMPIMMPWDDERLLPDGSRTPSERSEGIESATPMSELSSLSDAYEPPTRPKRRISEDLNAVDRMLMGTGVDDIPEEEEEDDDVPMDDIALREQEEAEEAREEEFQAARRRREQEKRMGSTP